MTVPVDILAVYSLQYIAHLQTALRRRLPRRATRHQRVDDECPVVVHAEDYADAALRAVLPRLRNLWKRVGSVSKRDTQPPPARKNYSS